MEMKEVIVRLNQLYHQSKKMALSPSELTERDQLRQQYLAFIRNQVKSSLDQIQIVAEEEAPPEAGQCNCKGNCHHH